MNIPTNAASLLSVVSCVGITMCTQYVFSMILANEDMIYVGCVCAVSTHPGMLAAWVYYVVMFLPVCGLVQHGIITLTADRYAYFPTVVFIPVLGACIAHGIQSARILLMFLGRYERGCALYDLELRQFPGSTHLLNNMGVCYMHMRKYDLAKQSFQRAIDYGLGLSGKHGADTETPQVNLKQLEGWDGQANYHAHLMW
ncbi:hypothetical protein DYB28_009198 [Aphanomyces astaci]|uniref:Uncharacterized protein n=1 Tax=Aphanomyces astaci TaxID=112090 RepID=A0A9X8E1M9_APHAT|nr:hypothetical protein DYB28_009198 [Aphanomyces astaci]